MTKRIIALLTIILAQYAVAIFALSSLHAVPLKHFSIQELTHSKTALRLNIDNTPQPHHITNLQRLVTVVLDPAREQIGIPIYVNSGYRCPRLNKAVGGAPKSFHLQGRAADITTRKLSNNMRLYLILEKLPHSELIWEQNGLWIHVAL
ncbi:MAG: peptidase M15 [Muribaculaceae bacterium]|nr:peptidase M15 [Muribaculaceae bacterium]